MTAQGHPRVIFRRALERGNLLLAEATAREIGWVSPAEALELTALIALQQPERGRRVAARWLARFVAEAAPVRIEDVVLASGLLLALGGERHQEVLGLLRGMAAVAPRELR